jgi:hypothetical protein
MATKTVGKTRIRTATITLEERIGPNPDCLWFESEYLTEIILAHLSDLRGAIPGLRVKSVVVND